MADPMHARPGTGTETTIPAPLSPSMLLAWPFLTDLGLGGAFQDPLISTTTAVQPTLQLQPQQPKSGTPTTTSLGDLGHVWPPPPPPMPAVLTISSDPLFDACHFPHQPMLPMWPSGAAVPQLLDHPQTQPLQLQHAMDPLFFTRVAHSPIPLPPSSSQQQPLIPGFPCDPSLLSDSELAAVLQAGAGWHDAAGSTHWPSLSLERMNPFDDLLPALYPTAPMLADYLTTSAHGSATESQDQVPSVSSRKRKRDKAEKNREIARDRPAAKYGRVLEPRASRSRSAAAADVAVPLPPALSRPPPLALRIKLPPHPPPPLPQPAARPILSIAIAPAAPATTLRIKTARAPPTTSPTPVAPSMPLATRTTSASPTPPPALRYLSAFAVIDMCVRHPLMYFVSEKYTRVRADSVAHTTAHDLSALHVDAHGIAWAAMDAARVYCAAALLPAQARAQLRAAFVQFLVAVHAAESGGRPVTQVTSGVARTGRVFLSQCSDRLSSAGTVGAHAVGIVRTPSVTAVTVPSPSSRGASPPSPPMTTMRPRAQSTPDARAPVLTPTPPPPPSSTLMSVSQVTVDRPCRRDPMEGELVAVVPAAVLDRLRALEAHVFAQEVHARNQQQPKEVIAALGAAVSPPVDTQYAVTLEERLARLERSIGEKSAAK
ncbi:hypothetical protein BC828DRAFT_404064 [Blastocladiella britannica]|nr:hypothetical protein BC828DRAFT_404064 [Blastocladiella britannica]